MKNLEDRSQEAETIVNWAFRQFTMKKFGTNGSEIGKAKVWNGKSRDVSLILENDLNVMIPVLSSSKPIFSIEYIGPIKAPIKKGDKIAELLINQKICQKHATLFLQEMMFLQVVFLLELEQLANIYLICSSQIPRKVCEGQRLLYFI